MKETSWGMPSFTSRFVCNSALKTQRAFFVYKPVIMLMTPRSHIGYFSIDQGDRHQNKVTTLEICACARLKEMKEMRDSTFKLPFIREDNKRESMPLSSLTTCSLCVNITTSIYTQKHPHLNHLFKWKTNRNVHYGCKQFNWTHFMCRRQEIQIITVVNRF